MLIVIMVSGCAYLNPSPKAPREAAPQATVLNFPGAPGKIAISPAFKQVGSAPLPMKNGNETSYIFAESADSAGGRLDRMVIVRHYFLHDTAGLSENLHEDVLDLIDRRNVALPSGPYQYALYKVDGLLRHEQEYLVAKGYLLSERYLAQSLARKLPAEKSPLADVTYVLYLEDITKTDNAFTDRAGRAVTIQ
jgi:hypothetical protein